MSAPSPTTASAAPAEAPVAPPAERAAEEPAERPGTDVPWVVLVWNDPVNLMSYVAYVFRSYFGYPPERAERLMRDVHEKGRAVVATGGREEMERDTEAMHGYGLWATVGRDG